jgi:3',5'-cyclic AMP phosphodiesterase CpdA
VDIFISRKIPYAAILGNHDDEGSLTRAQTIDLLTTLPYSLTVPGPSTLPGSGNYYVQVLAHSSHHSALTLYFMDTHGYSPDERNYKGYDWIKPEQISWFKDMAGALKGDNAKYSHIHLDMAFIHIPLPEYREAGIMVGQRREQVTAPNYNSGFYDALVEMGVPVVSCGHDHANDFCLFPDRQKSIDPLQSGAGQPVTPNKPKFDNIWLCYAGGAGFGGYGGYGGYHRRIRFFELDANEARIQTWTRLEYGDVEKRVDDHIVVDAGKVVVPEISDKAAKVGP